MEQQRERESVAALQRVAKELIDAAEPIAEQYAETVEEYVVPVDCIENVRAALMALQEGS